MAAGSRGRGAVPTSSTPYYRDRYWNELDGVNRYLQQRATGGPTTDWITHLFEWHRAPFRKALVLNCGNGWVERVLVERGVVAEAVGIDIAPDLLAEAEGAGAGLPIRYHRLDVNDAVFPGDGYDLVVNHAAAHHITHIDRVFRAIDALLPPDGVFVSWDYVGPHRNQYPGGMWEEAHAVNLTLPEALRSPMHYPLLTDMLVGDPSEAVHSELVLPTMRRYFTIEHDQALGGAVAYLLLTHNAPFLDAPPDETAPWLEAMLARDAAVTDACPDDTLFAYILARPNHGVLADAESLSTWSAQEDAREARAAADGGRYYPPTAVAEAIAHERSRPVPPGEACRRAAVSIVRATGRRIPPGAQRRVRSLPGVEAAWRRVSRVYRG
jgi:SAM-dependent methyltransferase